MKEQFTFKQFTINQDICAMKVGTDGVLLGSWAVGGKRILDVGTGTGLIALMMAQRYSNSHIDGIDIDTSACVQATGNITNSCFSSRIKIYNCDLQSYNPLYKYNSIVCNPPFFIKSLINQDHQRTIARHTYTLTPKTLFRKSFQLLTANGMLSIIIPTEQADLFLTEAYINGFFIHKKILLKTTEKKTAKRILITFGKQQTKSYQEEIQTLLTNNEKSSWYSELTREFYL